jgi:Pretoxin HINT domain
MRADIAVLLPTRSLNMEQQTAGKNEMCRCSSGKKFRQCCWLKRFNWAKDAPTSTKHEVSAETAPERDSPSSRAAQASTKHEVSAERPPPPTFWTHPPGQPDARPPSDGVWKEWFYVKARGWTHESELRPGQEYRLPDGSWRAVPAPVTIESTFEHPFFVKDKGWVALGEIKIGDQIRTDTGWVTVIQSTPTNRWEPVYNFRIADYHTYFVGGDEWGFAVWAHNHYTGKLPTKPLNYTKPAYGAPNDAAWRYHRYGYKAYQNGVDPAKLKDYQTWLRQDFLPAKKGGRPGRAGDRAQVDTRQRLQQPKEGGWEHSEVHKLGDHYPDLRRPNTRGGYDYAEVGAMTKGGKPKGHEYGKFLKEAEALEPGQRLYFFDKNDPRRFLFVENHNGKFVVCKVNS